MKHNKFKGFTLIELLVVISIIGLLSTLAMVALNNALKSSRDAKRVSDMKQLQTAMELAYDASTGTKTYPTCAAASAVSACTAGNIATYLGGIANMNDPAEGTTLCTSTSTAVCNYAFTTVGSSTGYTVTFFLEGASGNLAAGRHTLTQTGLH
jgi:prepilin-type N-terminal cleavage/methylation domain-containing protein